MRWVMARVFPVPAPARMQHRSGRGGHGGALLVVESR
jgi:hypothetical protein